MQNLPDYLDDVRRRERAARHTDSLVLAVHAVALGVLSVARGMPGSRPGLWQIAVPAVVYGLLWIVVRARERATGMGGGRDGFGAAAVLALALALFFPFSAIAAFMVGPAAFLALGLVALGLRRRSRRLWCPGLALVVLGPLVQLYTVDNHVVFLGPQPGVVVLALLAVLLAVGSLRAFAAERAVLVGPRP
ncbi:hypothetical protein [Cellulomonas xiejunii]|uniref:hypothetical protein n=1 Tax=Cellulomonas xiejunii TaxID=2968083 RepID=UPI001D0E1ABA|nr:hypothetical protein [Cellulomonas xiejunii]MCC2315466.1 hypothetical protein [Cellulomonas xiejunii]